MDIIRVIRSIFSLDTVIYVSILFVLLVSMARCLTPLASLSRKLRRAARVIITENKHLADLFEENILLTAKEYSLILFLAKNINRVFSKSSLCDEIWGYEYDGYDNTIMVHIRHLREKLEDNPSEPKYIKTLKGIGYKLVD